MDRVILSTNLLDSAVAIEPYRTLSPLSNDVLETGTKITFTSGTTTYFPGVDAARLIERLSEDVLNPKLIELEKEEE